MNQEFLDAVAAHADIQEKLVVLAIVRKERMSTANAEQHMRKFPDRMPVFTSLAYLSHRVAVEEGEAPKVRAARKVRKVAAREVPAAPSVDDAHPYLLFDALDAFDDPFRVNLFMVDGSELEGIPDFFPPPPTACASEDERDPVPSIPSGDPSFVFRERSRE